MAEGAPRAGRFEVSRRRDLVSPVPVAFGDWKRELRGEAGEWAILTAHGYTVRGVGWRGVDGTWYAQVEALRHVHRRLRG